MSKLEFQNFTQSYSDNIPTHTHARASNTILFLYIDNIQMIHVTGIWIWVYLCRFNRRIHDQTCNSNPFWCSWFLLQQICQAICYHKHQHWISFVFARWTGKYLYIFTIFKYQSFARSCTWLYICKFFYIKKLSSFVQITILVMLNGKESTVHVIWIFSVVEKNQ